MAAQRYLTTKLAPRQADKLPTGKRAPGMNARSSSWQVTDYSLDRLRNELCGMSTNTSGVAEAKRPVDFAILHGDEPGISHLPTYEKLENLAPRSGLSPTLQKRALSTASKVLHSKKRRL